MRRQVTMCNLGSSHSVSYAEGDSQGIYKKNYHNFCSFGEFFEYVSTSDWNMSWIPNKGMAK